MLQLGEYRFHIGRPSLSVFDALFRIQPFFCCLLVFSQGMVHLNDPVAGALVAHATHGTVMAVLRLVTADQLYKAYVVTLCPSPMCVIRCPIGQIR